MRNFIVPTITMLAATVLGFPAPIPAEGHRRALVVGINRYEPLTPLSAAANDAIGIGRALRDRAGFEVTTVIDPGSGTLLKNAIAEFAASVHKDDAVVVYYAGHGVQSNGKNYLIPGDFVGDETKLPELAISVDGLLADLARRDPAMKLVILDACRNNPFARRTGGLANMELSKFGVGTRVELAAAAGQTAQDGLFAAQLVKQLDRAGLTVEEVFNNVRHAVMVEAAKHGGKQEPLSISQLISSFYFVPADLAATQTAVSVLHQAASTLPTGDLGQTRAVEVLIQNNRTLSGTSLEGLSFKNGRFSGGIFRQVDFAGADLSGAVLDNADLTSATLRFATLAAGQLTGATLEKASLNFAEAACEPGANDRQCADFRSARARDSAWLGTSAAGADFSNADLDGARFMFADLRHARFNGASLKSAYFVGSDLTDASFDNATFANTDFTGARIDARRFSADQKTAACEIPTSVFGAAVVISIAVLDSTSNAEGPRSRFIEKQFLFRFTSNGFRPCAKRDLNEDQWYPIWHAGAGEEIRNDLVVVLPGRLLQQPGRRASVRDRIAGLEWVATKGAAGR